FTGYYASALEKFVEHRGLCLACVALIVLGSTTLFWVVGEDFFPAVDAGMMRLHVRAPSGTRIERSERIVDDIERTIRTIIPANELEGISDNIGVPTSYDLAFYQTDSTGPQDTDVLIQLKPRHAPTPVYQDRIRAALAQKFPGVQAYFQAADIIN